MFRRFYYRILKIAYPSFLFILLISTVVCCKARKNREGYIIPAKDVLAILEDTNKVRDCLIIDLRSRMDYIRGHLAPAVWITLDSLDVKLGLLPKDAKIILYDSTGLESPKAVEILKKNGFFNVYQMEIGAKDWVKNGYPMAIRLVENTSPTLNIQGKAITLEQVHEIVEKNNENYALIDIRPYLAYKAQHIKGAISIPYIPISGFVVKLAEQNYPRNKPLIIYAVGYTSKISDKAIDVLLRNNYTNVFLFAGGIEKWMSGGYPVVKDTLSF